MDKGNRIRYLINFITIILFLLISNPFIKLILAILYIGISFLSGSRIKILPNVILFSSIVFISILSPRGLIILSLGPITITQAALYSGISKSSMLIGLLYLSRDISISNLKFHGGLGLIIRDTFHYFNQLTSGDRVRFSTMITDIDRKLLDLKPYSINKNKSNADSVRRYNYTNFIATVLLVILDKFLYTF